MHFMLLIFAVLLCLVVWGFFHSDPTGVPRARLLALNVAILALAVVAGGIIGYVLYLDASVVKAGEKGLAVYLGIMAGGTAALIIVAAGGMLRNLVIFPLSRRERPTPGA
ncbi:MAG: hypothetical protein A3H34_07055 [Betaproteobacteria bacterium RIFCSPLOWO2_02_FULL_67_19]|nr:MAG: hypothetical protein A3H34_07055 [Betaproteobacteria bacterium RIFCSPLOWO2_02_FULL_67_19]